MRSGMHYSYVKQLPAMLVVAMMILLLSTTVFAQEGGAGCTDDSECAACSVCDETGNCVSNEDPDCDPFDTGPECQESNDCGGCGDCVEGACVFSFVNENGCYTEDDCPDDEVCNVMEDACDNYCSPASGEEGLPDPPDDPDSPEGLCFNTGGTWNECGSGWSNDVR